MECENSLFLELENRTINSKLMKKLALLVTGLLSFTVSFSQQVEHDEHREQRPQEKPKYLNPENVVIHATDVQVTFTGVTGNLVDYVEPPGTVNEVVKTFKVGYHPKDDWQLHESVNPMALPNGPDQSAQKTYPAPAVNKVLTQSFDGISNFNVSPADPTVDVGPNHVVQMTNGPSGAYIRVYSKTGTPIGSQVYFDNFMGMPAGLGDPVVLYDERADRWLLSEFSNSGNNMHVAISTTSDPSGSYYTYVVNSPSGFPDYPKYSIWDDAYIITANVSSSDVYALDRTSMLAGSATNAQMFTQSNFGTIGFQASSPVSLLGTVTPPAGAPAMIMRMRDDAWSGASTDALEIWNIDIDWANSSNSTLSMDIVLNMNFPYDSELCGYTSFSCIDQPGSTTNLDPLREVLMNRVMYRNFGTHESIVCCHVTDVTGNDDAGIRWYELRRTGGLAGSWSIYQESTYAPDSDSRWMPTIGLSETGNIGLAYNVSSSSTYPSIRYTGRKECDPLNQMTEPETVIVAGTTYNASNRYGDYNAMGVDPSDGETFWMTGMYNPTTAGKTRIAAFNIDVCNQYPEVAFNVTSLDVEESSADVANGCLDYVVVDIPMSIGVAPSQNADITVVVTGGTATQGVDFDLMGSNFTLAGSTLTGSAQLRIYNDDYVESTETILLGYTMNANGGDATAAATNQSVTVNILDDDLDPASMTNSVVVFTHDFESGLAPVTTVNNAGGPQNDPWAVGDAAAASSTAFTVPTTNATQMAWINDDACNCTQNDVDLTLPSVDLTGFTGASMSFYTYYENNSYNGDQEVASVEVSVNGGAFNQIYLVPATSWGTVTVDLTPYVGNNNVVVNFNYSDGTGWLYGWAVDDVVISGDGPIAVQTAVNTGAGMTANLGPNETVHFYDAATSKVMMSLENTSSWDYGCVTVEVDRAGTSASQFNTANTTDYLHDKTYTVTPTNDNPSGTYNVTLYYEEAEVAGWEAATGNSRNNAEVIKVSGNNAISDVTPATAGSYTIANIAATLGAFNSDVTFTASFSTGFSGFGVGVYNVGNNPPVANFTSTTACAGDNMNFSDASTNAPTSWSWDFGDGSGTSTNQNPTYAYAAGGTYTVSLTATNAYGSDTYTQSVTVNGLPAVTASSDVAICNGSNTTLSVTGASSYSWDNGAGTGSSVTVTPTSTTTYTVTGTDANGCVNTDVVTVTVNPIPVIAETASTNPSACATATGSITIGSSGTGDLSWTGTASGTASSVTLPYTVNSLAAGTYTFTFVDASGCTSSSISSTISDPGAPAAPAVTPSGTVSFCQGGTATLTSSYATGNTWSTTESTQSISVGTAGTYTVYYTDGSGCVSNSTSVTVVENPLPTVNAGNDVSVCQGGTTTLSATGASSYTWDNGAGTGSSVTVAPSATTTYTVTGVDANGCVNSDAVVVTVNALPTVTASADMDICEGSSTTLTALGAASYSWDNGAGSGSSVTVSPAASTTYTVTGTDANGCQNTDQVVVTVNPLPTVSITPATINPVCVDNADPITLVGSPTGGTFSGPGVSGSTFTPSSAGVGIHTISYNYTDGNGCTGTNTVVVEVQDCSGVGEELLEGVVLSPNPNDGNFEISGLDLDSKYTIVDERGRIVLDGKVETKDQKIKVMNLQSGAYFLNGVSNGKAGIMKFIVMN